MIKKWGQHVPSQNAKFKDLTPDFARGKTGATPYFLFSENRELYRLFRATECELIIGSCTPFSGETDFKSVPLIAGTQGSEKMRKEDLK